MITLADLHALALRAHGPGLNQCADRSPVGIVRGYGLGHVRLRIFGGALARTYLDEGFEVRWPGVTPETVTLHMSDAGTALCVRVLLALALGLDPGPRGEWVTWDSLDQHRRWVLANRGDVRIWTSDIGATTRPPLRWVAPRIAALTDPIEALAAAVRHVLETP